MMRPTKSTKKTSYQLSSRKLTNKSVQIGNERIKVEAMYNQIQADINTLEKQLAVVRNDTDSNVFNEYQQLLECRISVRQWLKEYYRSLDTVNNIAEQKKLH